MIVCDNERKSSPQQFTKQGNIAPEIIKNNMQRFSESYKIELQHFVNVVAGKYCLITSSFTSLHFFTNHRKERTFDQTM